MPDVGEGRRGRAWIAWMDLPPPPWDPNFPRHPPYYAVSLQGPPEDPDLFEDGGQVPTLAEALAWARARTDWIVVRPQWDPATSYWAGTGSAPLSHGTPLPVLPAET